MNLRQRSEPNPATDVSDNFLDIFEVLRAKTATRFIVTFQRRIYRHGLEKVLIGEFGVQSIGDQHMPGLMGYTDRWFCVFYDDLRCDPAGPKDWGFIFMDQRWCA